MKTLLIIRHAKAESAFTLNDFERPLNERGKLDAPIMAERVKKRNIKLDVLISSPAKRAKKTALLFGETFNKNEEEIIFVSALYHAHTEVFFDVIKGINDSFNRAAVFSHNPGITNFANQLVGNVQTDNIPTCGVFAVTADCISWKDFAKAKKELLFFDYPKNT